jgi:pimeloyl-ACP methyl ester carboxylesterase
MASMTDQALVFVHSPLVGPSTWRSVAQRCAADGWTTAVADLTRAMAGPPPYQPELAAAVAQVADPLHRPVVLVGHSGAGPLLPGIAAELSVPVRALVYVDAGLPYPGRSWFEAAPAQLVDRLAGLAADGWLPAWHEWFEPEVLAAVLPERRLRDEFTAELDRLPLAYFQEPMSPATWPGAAGVLLLSEGYRGDAVVAEAQGLTVVEHRSHHLAMLTDPDEVASALREVLAQLLTIR